VVAAAVLVAVVALEVAAAAVVLAAVVAVAGAKVGSSPQAASIMAHMSRMVRAADFACNFLIVMISPFGSDADRECTGLVPS
jgi:hypothetical protein